MTYRKQEERNLKDEKNGNLKVEQVIALNIEQNIEQQQHEK